MSRSRWKLVLRKIHLNWSIDVNLWAPFCVIWRKKYTMYNSKPITQLTSDVRKCPNMQQQRFYKVKKLDFLAMVLQFAKRNDVL